MGSPPRIVTPAALAESNPNQMQALDWVRYQLEELSGYRFGGPLSPRDEKRYQRLCEAELRLLHVADRAT